LAIIAVISKNHSNTMSYLKFLRLVNTVRQLPIYPAMDATEIHLLNVLAEEWHSGNKISVVQAMGMLPDVSPSSVHRRLKTLRAKGLIALDEDKLDGRIKYIVSTRLFNKYLSKMDECLSKAIA
jgi:DNA-binding MarR family transcriptional regulator